jgi:uncharacterized membrane protein (UPF0127 family)
MRIINKTKNRRLAEQAEVAKTIFKRAKGLLGKNMLQAKEAMIIETCNSVHTFFMRFPIDILFVGKNNKVVGIAHNVSPWRLSPIYWKAAFVIEFPAEAIKDSGTEIGDELAFD